MTTASEIQQLALDVFENKLNYKDNDFICVMNILKESYMKVKGLLNEVGSVKEVDSDSDEEEDISRYATYDSEDDSDDESYTGSYLSPY